MDMVREKRCPGRMRKLRVPNQTSHRLQIGAAPGLTAFVTNNMAVEVSINVVGLDFKWIEQTTNQVEHGSYRQSSADFKINIFSINIGICTYF